MSLHHSHSHQDGLNHDHNNDADTLEARNSEHFNKTAKEYEDPASTFMTSAIAGKLREMLDDTVTGDTVIMDYACGPGLVSFNFLDKAKRIVGVDVAQGMVDVFNQRAKDKGYSEDRTKAVIVSKGDLSSIVATEGRFDIIMCNHSYHHFHDLDEVTSALAEALAPGGVLIVSDFLAMDSPDHTPFGGNDAEAQAFAASHGVHHKHGFTKQDMQDLFGRHLKDVQVDDSFFISKKELKERGGESKMVRFLKDMEKDDRLRYVIASGKKA